MGVLLVSAAGWAFIAIFVAAIIYAATLAYFFVGNCPGMSTLSKWMAGFSFVVGSLAKSTGVAIIVSVLSYIFGGTLNMANRDGCNP